MLELIACMFNQLSYLNCLSEQVNFESQLASYDELLNLYFLYCWTFRFLNLAKCRKLIYF